MQPVAEKVVQAISPASASGAAFTSNVIDTLGFDHLTFDAAFGAIGANVAALKVQESDAKTNDTTLNGGADVTGTVVGTDDHDGGATSGLPVTGGGDNNKTWRFEIDLKGRKRYLQLQCTAGAGATLLCALARLTRGETAPTSASQKGVEEVMRSPVIS